jgi:hypothetical protein
VLAFRPAKFDRDISTFGISSFTETLAEGSYTACKYGRRFGAKISDDRHRRLLRAHRKWPRGCAAKHGKQFSPSNADCHVTLPRGSMPQGTENNTTIAGLGASHSN